MDYLRFYNFFNCDFTPVGKDNHKSDCPLCLKEEHFFVNDKTGQFNCKKCGETGNVYSFMTKFHAMSLSNVTDEDYEELSSLRGISAETFKLAKLGKDHNGTWIVPYRSHEGDNLCSIGRFNPDASNDKLKFRIFKASELPLSLYRFNEKVKKGAPSLISEGEWDIWAVVSAYRSAKKSNGYNLYGSPGNNWNEKWNKDFKGQDVIFIPDNDDGGLKFRESIAKKAKGFSYSFANWNVVDDYFPDGFEGKDPRDILNATKVKAEVLPIYLDMITEATLETESADKEETSAAYSIDVDSIEPLPSRKKFRENVLRAMYTNDSILKCIDIVMAAALCVNLPGEPVWIFLSGEASSGKTFLIESFGGENKYFDYASKLTHTSLVSGWKPTGSDEESSGLPKFNRKTLFIKDMTVILDMDKGAQQQLWAMFRDIYDGYIKIPFGNGKVFKATGIKIGCIAGVTHAIQARNDSEMGERFLKLDYLGRDKSEFCEDEHMDKAWESMDKKKENKELMVQTILGYYKHLAENFKPEELLEVPPEIKEKLRSLAKLVVRLSTKVTKDRHEGMVYRPKSAIATRLFLTFGQLIRVLAYVRQEKTITNETFECVKKLAFDTCNEFNFQVVDYIHHKGSAKRGEMITDLRIPSTRMHQILTDFEALSIVNRTKEDTDEQVSGRPNYTYTLNETVEACLTDTIKRRKPVVKNSNGINIGKTASKSKATNGDKSNKKGSRSNKLRSSTTSNSSGRATGKGTVRTRKGTSNKGKTGSRRKTANKA